MGKSVLLLRSWWSYTLMQVRGRIHSTLMFLSIRRRIYQSGQGTITLTAVGSYATPKSITTSYNLFFFFFTIAFWRKDTLRKAAWVTINFLYSRVNYKLLSQTSNLWLFCSALSLKFTYWTNWLSCCLYPRRETFLWILEIFLTSVVWDLMWI